jgi:OOP family OmpA-OmpF porin
VATNLSKRLRDLDNKKPRPNLPPMPGQRDPNDDKPMDGVVFVMMSMTGLVALIVLAVFFGTRSIESGLENKIAADLEGFEVTEIDVRAEARDVLVVGLVSDEARIEEVVEYLASLEGVTSFETNLQVRIEIDPGEVQISAEPIAISWTPTGATVVGNASSQDFMDAFLLSLEDTFGAVDAAGLTVKEGIESERDWFTSFLQLTQSMRQLTPEGAIFVSPDDRLIQVTAEFENRADRSDARQVAADIISATTFEFTSALTYKDAPPPPREEQVIELQANIDELIEGKIVEFETDSDVIAAVGTALLDEILAALQQFPDVSIEIAGHTDDLGSEEYNDELSRRRADAVLAYLVARGEPVDRFLVSGYGESRPIADNTTADGRARNRRIEFKALLEG